MKRYEFASDNTAGVCSEALSAIIKANEGFCASYGDDEYTNQAAEAFRELFGRQSEVFFVFTGTAANSLAISQLCRSHHSVICHEVSHIETDECGAPEFFSNGVKLLTTSGRNGKLTPEAVEHLATKRKDIHYPKPRVLSLTLPTELGTVYTLDELAALRDVARRHNLSIHLDGARFGNAVVALNCTPADILEASGADVLCFGGTKGGIGLTEAVLFFDKEMASEFDYRCKQAGQLASKMRILSAPWATMLNEGFWMLYAQQANGAAQSLGSIMRQSGIEPLYPVEANTVFARLPEAANEYLREKGWHFYDFIGGASRFMCSYRVTPEIITEFGIDLRDAMQVAEDMKAEIESDEVEMEAVGLNGNHRYWG